MRPNSGLTSLPDWIQWLLIAGVIAIPVLWLLYSHKSNELADTERYSRFQSFLMECRCERSGTGYAPDGVEETEYTCSKGGGTTSFSDYAQFTDEFYDPREQEPTRLCPSE